MAGIPAQVIGTEAGLSTKAEASPSAIQKTGATYQKVGTDVPLNHSSTMQSPSAVASKGTYQVIGDCVQISQQPIKAIGNSSKLPFSDRAHEQSAVGQAKAKEVRK